MNKTFIECRDHLFATNMTEDQMRSLHDVAMQFQTFVKDARNPSEERKCNLSQELDYYALLSKPPLQSIVLCQYKDD